MTANQTGQLLSDEEFARELWFHQGILLIIGSGAIQAAATTLMEDFVSAERPVASIEEIHKRLIDQSDDLMAKAKQQTTLPSE